MDADTPETRMPLKGSDQVWGYLRKYERCLCHISLRINDSDANRMRRQIGKTGRIDLTHRQMERRRHTRIR